MRAVPNPEVTRGSSFRGRRRPLQTPRAVPLLKPAVVFLLQAWSHLMARLCWCEPSSEKCHVGWFLSVEMRFVVSVGLAHREFANSLFHVGSPWFFCILVCVLV